MFELCWTLTHNNRITTIGHAHSLYDASRLDVLLSAGCTQEFVYRHGLGEDRSFQFVKGPLFTNLLLADEINRTPPKTQSALLEAMQERQVTAAGKNYRLPDPFFVLATQNPIEQEGTYPLPEAQLDRFMYQVNLDYPSFKEEVQILKQTTAGFSPSVSAVMKAEEVSTFQNVVREVPVPDSVIVH